MSKLIVTVNKLNKRTSIPRSFSDKSNIAGIVMKNYTFLGDEVTGTENKLLGKWYKDRENYFYWAGGLAILEDDGDVADVIIEPDNAVFESFSITPVLKRKIEQVINAFETGSAAGRYDMLVKYRDYNDPVTKAREVQVTFGRSQTTEYGHLKALVQDYVAKSNHPAAAILAGYVNRIGKKPTLADDDTFCKALKDAGKNDPVMRICQDHLFDTKYYNPAYKWYTENGFKQPLSMLVIYDSFIHSGSMLSFLRKRFSTVVPSNGGNEKDWIKNYVDVRNNWLATHSNEILRKTVYRMKCFKEQIQNNNWDLAQTINANGIKIA